MRWPLTVSVATKGGLRPVTRHVSRLRFGHVAPGGHHVCSFTLRMREDEMDGIGAASRVVVADARTGRAVWDGYAEWPEPVTVEAGVTAFEVTALGGMVLLADELAPRLWVDAPSITEDDARWRRVKLTAPGATVDFGSAPAGDDESYLPSVLIQFLSGQKVDNTSRTATEYVHATDAAASIVGVALTGGVGGGVGYAAKVTGRLADGSGRDVVTTAMGDGAIAWLETRTPRDGSSALKDLRLQLHRDSGGVTTVPDDAVVARFHDLSVVAEMKRLDGTARISSDFPDAAGATGLAAVGPYLVPVSWVVEDIAKRVPNTAINPNVASIDHTADYAIDQLAYLEPTTYAEVLDDMTVLEPDYVWEMLAHTGSGHRFNYRKWEDRYLIPPSAGVWDQSGADTDLCNRIRVSWQTRSGRTRTVTVTANVPALGARVRDADPIELPPSVGSAKNAQRVGEQVLAEHVDPPEAGTFTAHGRIYDSKWGRWVEPWEIEAGWWVTLQATGQRLRLTGVECDDEEGVATLALGDRSLTLEQRVAQLDTPRRATKKRRRRGSRK